MKLIHEQSVTFRGEDGESLRIGYDNRGEPYRRGISLTLEEPGDRSRGVFIEEWEVRQMQNLLDTLYPRKS